MSNHRVRGPYCFEPGDWHIDGNFKHGYELPGLQVFYYPQDTTPEMGPTDLVPGSHHIRMKRRYMSNFDNIATAFSSTAPAGSIFICCYPIWHRRGTATSTRLRNMLKYYYWRTNRAHAGLDHRARFRLCHRQLRVRFVRIWREGEERRR